MLFITEHSMMDAVLLLLQEAFLLPLTHDTHYASFKAHEYTH